MPVLWAPVGAVGQHGRQPAGPHVAVELLPHLIVKVFVLIADQEHRGYLQLLRARSAEHQELRFPCRQGGSKSVCTE